MPGILCEYCTAVCCRYIALPIETPEEHGEFDDVRWYLMHENVSVFVEDGEWYICFSTTCRHLQPDHRCGVYETRPRICRNYSTSNCDYHSGDYGWEQHFTCPEHLDQYVRDFFSRNGKPRSRKTPKRRKGLRHMHSRRRLMPTGRPRLIERRVEAPTHDIRGVPLPVLAGELR
jgi:Fe-S-cluster containining protein